MHPRRGNTLRVFAPLNPITTLKLNTKFAESFFLCRRKVTFDGTQRKLMAHLMKVRVREKAIYRNAQAFDRVGNASAATFERLFDRNQLISESESRNGMAFVNSKNDFPVFRIKHDVGEVGRYGIPTLSRSALQGVAFAPASHEAATPCVTQHSGRCLGHCLSKLRHVAELRELSAMRAFIAGEK